MDGRTDGDLRKMNETNSLVLKTTKKIIFFLPKILLQFFVGCAKLCPTGYFEKLQYPSFDINN